MIIAVDFDGTIVEHQYPKIGPEIPGASETIMDLWIAEHQIIIWTCRTLTKPEAGLFEMIEWLEEHEVPYNAINCNMFGAEFYSMPKIYADVYIDDKNFGGFPGWDAVRKQLLEKP